MTKLRYDTYRLRAIMYSRLQRTHVTRIPIKYGNLGSKLHYALRIPVRVIKRKQIEVTHVE